MNIKFKIIAIIVFVLMGVGIYMLANAYFQIKNDNTRLIENTALLSNDLEYHKSRSGELYAKNKVLTYRNKEFNKAFPKLIKEIEDLKVNPKRILSVNSTVLENNKAFVSILKDSLINDTLIAKIFDYKDEFYKVRGVAVNDSQRVEIQSTDSIIQVVYKGKRKRPYLWFLSKRQLEQVISNKNPNSKISYSKHIEIIRKK